jgi:hypothetical protein
MLLLPYSGDLLIIPALAFFAQLQIETVQCGCENESHIMPSEIIAETGLRADGETVQAVVFVLRAVEPTLCPELMRVLEIGLGAIGGQLVNVQRGSFRHELTTDYGTASGNSA